MQSHQTNKSIFHRTRTKDLKICIETQNSLNSQSNLKKNGASGIRLVDFRRQYKAKTVSTTSKQYQFSSVAYQSNSLWPHGLQHARLPCPSTTPGVCSDSCPLSWWCHPTISSSVFSLILLPSIFPSIRGFSKESVLCIKWPKYWSFSSSINPSNEYSGLISFRIDWFDLFAVQGTLKSLLQHHSSKAAIVWPSASFVVQISFSYMTIWKKKHSFDYMEFCQQGNVSAF